MTKAELIEALKSLKPGVEAIDNTRVERFIQSEKKVQRILWEVVQVLVSLIESKDPDSAHHHQEVSNVARYIAEELGLSDKQTEGLCMAGLLHDIGKINMPIELLRKTSSLSENELKMIRTHPQIGYEILKKIEFSMPVATIVLQHHEKLNGTGYPSGLSGNEILLEARILLVSDIMEVMTSPRPYRPAHSIEEAIEEISQNKGVLYDSNVVDACRKVFNL